jgi:hypothetical protein
MNVASATLQLPQLLEIYDEVELVILLDWFGIKRPDQLAHIELELHEQMDQLDESSSRIRLMKSCDGCSNKNALANAVARLALSKIQARLPQWAAVCSDGHVDLARAYTSTRDGKVDLLPRFLFTINWADSGPGFSWPESYYATYLPGFDLYVVTASQDSPEMHGYTDEAIGHFPVSLGVVEGARPVITGWWNWQAKSCSQYRWAYLFQAGEVSEEAAEVWADEVWDRETGEPV